MSLLTRGQQKRTDRSSDSMDVRREAASRVHMAVPACVAVGELQSFDGGWYRAPGTTRSLQVVHGLSLQPPHALSPACCVQLVGLLLCANSFQS